MLFSGPRAGLVASSAAIATALAIDRRQRLRIARRRHRARRRRQSVITSTTKIAGAGVLGNQRRPDESCAPEPAPVDPGPPDRARSGMPQARPRCAPIRSASWCSPATSSTRCARWACSHASWPPRCPTARRSQPSYLGTVIHDVPGAGTRSAPDVAAIKAATPDLILGSAGPDPGRFGELSAIAPTVFTGAPGAAWQDNLRTVGAATGRLDAANALIDDFERAADKTGADNDATHFQASVVQFTDTTMRVYGADNFPGSVLAAVGVDRPAAQRFTDKPYVEIGITDTDLENSPDFSAADGDIVYVSFDSAAAKDRAPRVLDSDAWRKLSANRDNRVFAVNNEVWQTGEGIVAARGILDDLRWINAPIN